jgi:hypothetical protein
MAAGENDSPAAGKRSDMKKAAIFAAVILVAGFASASANDYTIKLFSPVVVAGTELKPGTYAVEVREGQVFIKGDTQSVVALARTEEVPTAYPATSVRYLTTESGNVLQEIRLGHSTRKIVFPDPMIAKNSRAVR